VSSQYCGYTRSPHKPHYGNVLTVVVKTRLPVIEYPAAALGLTSGCGKIPSAARKENKRLFARLNAQEGALVVGLEGDVPAGQVLDEELLPIAGQRLIGLAVAAGPAAIKRG
jgi:hypothetical protein